MQHQPSPADLPDQWRELAAQQRRLGADSQARILDFCADELAAAFARAAVARRSMRRFLRETERPDPSVAEAA